MSLLQPASITAAKPADDTDAAAFQRCILAQGLQIFMMMPSSSR